MSKIDPKQSLISTQLNNIMANLLCRALLKKDGNLIENQVEIQSTDFIIETELDGYDNRLIVNYFSEKDSHNRIGFNIKILTFNSREITHIEMIFDSNNSHNEGSFKISIDELVTKSLLEFLENNQDKIIKNIF